MRTGTVVKAMLSLLVASFVAIAVAQDGSDPTSPVPAAPRPSPLPGDAMGSDYLDAPQPIPLSGEAAPRAAAARSESVAGPCPAVEAPCGRCGGLRSCYSQMGLGASVHAAMKAQICNGVGARMVLYRYDFCDRDSADSAKLNEHGAARLRDLARMFAYSSFHPIVIEPTACNASLDAARREYVVKMLNQMNASVPDALVVVAQPETPALSGREAILLDARLMSRTLDEGKYPQPSPSTESSTSSMSSGGGQSGGTSSGR